MYQFTAIRSRGPRCAAARISEDPRRSPLGRGDRNYQLREIPAGPYPALEAGRKGRDLKTVTVGATLFVSQRWAAEHHDAHSYFVAAILPAKPAILARVAPG